MAQTGSLCRAPGFGPAAKSVLDQPVGLAVNQLQMPAFRRHGELHWHITTLANSLTLTIRRPDQFERSGHRRPDILRYCNDWDKAKWLWNKAAAQCVLVICRRFGYTL